MFFFILNGVYSDRSELDLSDEIIMQPKLIVGMFLNSYWPLLNSFYLLFTSLMYTFSEVYNTSIAH